MRKQLVVSGEKILSIDGGLVLADGISSTDGKVFFYTQYPNLKIVEAEWPFITFKEDCYKFDDRGFALPVDLIKNEKILMDAIKTILDDFAKIKGYDSIISAVSYVNSTNATFAAEAEAAIVARDLLWWSVFEYLNKVKSKDVGYPTSLDDIVPHLAIPV